MRRQQAIELLRRHRDDIAAHGVRAMYLFGSTARDEAKAGSDVDLLVDYEEGFSLLDLVALKEHVGRLLGSTADLTTRAGLHPLLRDDILREAERVF